MSSRLRVVLFAALLLLGGAAVASADCYSTETWVVDEPAHWEVTDYGLYYWVAEQGHWETTVQCQVECHEEDYWVVDEPAHTVRELVGYTPDGQPIYEEVNVPEQGHYETQMVCRY